MKSQTKNKNNALAAHIDQYGSKIIQLLEGILKGLDAENISIDGDYMYFDKLDRTRSINLCSLLSDIFDPLLSKTIVTNEEVFQQSLFVIEKTLKEIR